MLAFPNERFVTHESLLKMLFLTPEAGGTNITGTRALDLQLSFVLRDRTTGAVAPIVSLGSPKEEDMGHLRVPWSYGEFSLKNVPPGSYTLEVRRDLDLVAQADVTVLTEEALAAIIDELAAEKGTSRRPIESAATLLMSWEAAWEDLYAYLRVRIPTHITVVAQPPIRTNPALAAVISREAFRWVSFHVHRLVFESAMLGGTIVFSQNADNPLHFRYTIQSRVSADLAWVERRLNHLRRLLRATDYSLELGWNLEKPNPPARQRATLDVKWSNQISAA